MCSGGRSGRDSGVSKKQTDKREVPVEGATCAVCAAPLTREYGSLMCSNKECTAYRGPMP